MSLKAFWQLFLNHHDNFAVAETDLRSALDAVFDHAASHFVALITALPEVLEPYESVDASQFCLQTLQILWPATVLL